MSGPQRHRLPLPCLAAVGILAVGVMTVVGVVSAGTVSATPSTLMTITGVSPHLVAATTANQAIAVTGTGFDEDIIASVDIAGCTSVTYIATSATTLAIKTDATCAVGTNRIVTITDTDGNTAVSNPTATGGGQALSFVAPPSISTPTASSRPVVTANTASLVYASQQTSGSTSGGTVVKVTAGSTPFVTTTATPLAASLAGVALTNIAMAVGGGSFTGVLGPHAAIANPVLKITSGGVSKSFAFGVGGGSGVAGTHDFGYAGNTIAVSPASGPANGGNSITVTGAGFTSSTTVAINSVTCVKVSQTATSFVCTVPASTTAGPFTVVATTGSTTSVVSAGSTYTYLAQ